jgi:hypothetical protein
MNKDNPSFFEQMVNKAIVIPGLKCPAMLIAWLPETKEYQIAIFTGDGIQSGYIYPHDLSLAVRNKDTQITLRKEKASNGPL